MALLEKIKSLIRKNTIEVEHELKKKLEYIYYSVDSERCINDPVKGLIILNTYASSMNDLIYDRSAVKSNDLYAVQAKIFFHDAPVKSYIYQLINADLDKFSRRKLHDIEEIANYFIDNS
jgi:hypothetical protein